ncbi:MAG: hypothetical protein L6R38_001741 [Xanthoria sp. 2 TBL-2021]|nr:MAG: hypothetical protein L6R38_001741 [Xanthoria sp. 2 TBL-2021]
MSTQDFPPHLYPLPASARAKLPLLNQSTKTLRANYDTNKESLDELSVASYQVRYDCAILDELLRNQESKLLNHLPKYRMAKVYLKSICICHTKVMEYFDVLVELRRKISDKNIRLRTGY